MSQVTDEIKSRINLVDLVGEYVRLQKAGTNWKGLCPFHNEKTPSFVVSEEKQIWHCFGCGKGGDIFSFLMEIESLDFKDALKILAEKSGVQLSNYLKNDFSSKKKNEIRDILELATKFYEKQLWKGAGKKKALNYLKERGLKDDIIKKFRLGYALPGWHYLQNFLLKKGYSLEQIESTGLLVRRQDNNKIYDRFRERIIFPILNTQEQVVGYSARTISQEEKTQAKYINTPETILYHKSQILYGIDKAKLAIKQNNQVVLVEGNMDVIACHQAGLNFVVAVSGTALTLDQLKILKRYTRNLKLFFDMDEAGQQAAQKSAKLAFQEEFNVELISSTQGKDAAEIAKENPNKLVKSIKESQPAMQYFLKVFLKKYDINTASGQKKIVAESLEMIKNFNNPIEKEYWLKELAKIIKIEKDILLGLLNDLKNEPVISKKTIEKRLLSKENKDKKNRIKIILKEITGLILNDSSLWKKIVIKNEKYPLLKLDNYLWNKIILEYGPKINYNFDELRIYLQDEKIRQELERQYFNTRYDFENESLNDFNSVGIEKKFKKLYNELEKEIAKNKLTELEKQIKEAEAKGDHKLRQQLMKEFVYFSKKTT